MAVAMATARTSRARNVIGFSGGEKTIGQRGAVPQAAHGPKVPELKPATPTTG
jgi:hypothetical protein